MPHFSSAQLFVKAIKQTKLKNKIRSTDLKTQAVKSMATSAGSSGLMVKEKSKLRKIMGVER